MTPRESQKEALEAAVKELDERIAANRSALNQFQVSQNQQIAKLESEVERLREEARRKSRSYRKDMGTMSYLIGFVSLFVTVIGAFAVFGGRGPEDRSDGMPMLLGGLVVTAIIFRHPFLKYFRATLPANELRAQISERQTTVERQKDENVNQLAQETARLDADLAQLKQDKEKCKSALQTM